MSIRQMGMRYMWECTCETKTWVNIGFGGKGQGMKERKKRRESGHCLLAVCFYFPSFLLL